MPKSTPRRVPPRNRSPRPTKPAAHRTDPLDQDFGPGDSGSAGSESTEAPRRSAGGPIPGLACAGDGCVLKPLADLGTRFALQFARGHVGSLSRAAFSAIELMKALRDFLDEEIQLAERAAGRGETTNARYVKIAVE